MCIRTEHRSTYPSSASCLSRLHGGSPSSLSPGAAGCPHRAHRLRRRRNRAGSGAPASHSGKAPRSRGCGSWCRPPHEGAARRCGTGRPPTGCRESPSSRGSLAAAHACPSGRSSRSEIGRAPWSRQGCTVGSGWGVATAADPRCGVGRRSLRMRVVHLHLLRRTHSGSDPCSTNSFHSGFAWTRVDCRTYKRPRKNVAFGAQQMVLEG